MSSVPMPKDMSEEAVAEWLYVNSDPFNESRVPWGGLYDGERNKWRFLARAVLALVRAKAREAVMDAADGPVYAHCGEDGRREYDEAVIDAIVARVLGEETPRG